MQYRKHSDIHAEHKISLLKHILVSLLSLVASLGLWISFYPIQWIVLQILHSSRLVHRWRNLSHWQIYRGKNFRYFLYFRFWHNLIFLLHNTLEVLKYHSVYFLVGAEPMNRFQARYLESKFQIIWKNRLNTSESETFLRRISIIMVYMNTWNWLSVN